VETFNFLCLVSGGARYLILSPTSFISLSAQRCR